MCFILSVIWLSGFLWYFVLITNTVYSPLSPSLVPKALVLAMTCLVFLPFPVFHFHTRKWVAKTMATVAAAPFFTVTFADFYMGDQLSSLVSNNTNYE